MADPRWTGNPLHAEGSKLILDHVTGELWKVHPQGQDWVLNVVETSPWRMMPWESLLTVTLRNLRPEAAKREADLLLSWAECYYATLSD